MICAGSCMKHRLCLLIGALFSALALASAESAPGAHNYWNVWHNYLPDGSGDRSKHSPYQGAGGPWQIRISWTTGTHDMHFSWILNSGSWRNLSALFYGGSFSGFWDRYYQYFPSDFPSGVAKGGCQNPAGESTVWANCRHASNL